MVRRFFVFLLMAVSLSFAGRYVMNVLSDSTVEFPQSQTIAQKLQTAPVAYYGSLIQRKYLQKDFYQLESAEFEQKFPEVYKSFVG